jgi:hypothetical protein
MSFSRPVDLGGGATSMDSALDSLCCSYLDGVPVTISPRFQMPLDLEAVEAVLNTPVPNIDAIDQWKVREEELNETMIFNERAIGLKMTLFRSLGRARRTIFL